MKRAFIPLAIAAGIASCMFSASLAETMDWVGADQFDDAVLPYRVDRGLQPQDMAVRIVNGNPEYKIIWQEYEGGFSNAIFLANSRAEAEQVVRRYADPKDAHLLHGDPKLCVHKFAHARDGNREFFLLYMSDPDNSGLRCITLP